MRSIHRLYRDTGGHPLYLRTLLSEGSGFGPRAPGRLALPRSLAAAISYHLMALPPQTRSILEMLSVLNLRLPIAQLGYAAQVGSPSAAIEPAVASGLVDWWPEQPSCPVEIRHLLVRDAIYAGITPTQPSPVARPRCLGVVSEPASWEHRVAALDQPDEGLAAELERLAGKEAADGRLALAATHLQWASDISPAQIDRERRLLTAALHLTLADESRGAALRPAVEGSDAVTAAQLRAGHDGNFPGPARRGGAAIQPGAGAGAERAGQPAAGRLDCQPAVRHRTRCWGTGISCRHSAAGRWAPGAWTRRPSA